MGRVEVHLLSPPCCLRTEEAERLLEYSITERAAMEVLVAAEFPQTAALTEVMALPARAETVMLVKRAEKVKAAQLAHLVRVLTHFMRAAAQAEMEQQEELEAEERMKPPERLIPAVEAVAEPAPMIWTKAGSEQKGMAARPVALAS